MIAPLLAVAWAALPPSGDATWLELHAAAQLDVRTMSSSFPNQPDGQAIGGAGTFAIDAFGRRVVDAEAAPPLQPFLQRVARFHVEGGGGAAIIEYPARVLSAQQPSGFIQRYRAEDRSARFATEAEGYIGRWIHLAARAGLSYDSWEPAPLGLAIGGFDPAASLPPGVAAHADASELMLDASAAVGVRWRDLLVSAGWGVHPFRIGADPLQVRFWGNAFVDARAVVRRFVELRAHVEVLDGGAAVRGDVTVWLRRRFGLAAGVEGGHGAFADSPVAYDRAGGHVGLAWWWTPRVAAALAYAPAWQQATPVAGIGTAIPEFSFVAHLLTLAVTWRPASVRLRQ